MTNPEVPKSRRGFLRSVLAIPAALAVPAAWIAGRKRSAMATTTPFRFRCDNRSLPLMNEELVRKWVEKWRRDNGSYPDPKALHFEHREWWALIDRALADGHYGLPGGSSLSKFVGNS